jgi:hypothetical protein
LFTTATTATTATAATKRKKINRYDSQMTIHKNNIYIFI